MRPPSEGTPTFSPHLRSDLCYPCLKVKAELDRWWPALGVNRSSESPTPRGLLQRARLGLPPPRRPRSPQARLAPRSLHSGLLRGSGLPRPTPARPPIAGPRLPSSRRAMPRSRSQSAPPPLQLCRAHVPPSASSGRCAGARGRAGKARRAVAAAHWPLWTSLACMANGKRPGRGYRFGSPPPLPVGQGTSRGAERGGAGWGWAGNEGAGPVDVGFCPCGSPLSP